MLIYYAHCRNDAPEMMFEKCENFGSPGDDFCKAKNVFFSEFAENHFFDVLSEK
jgi:hypothetical protein